MLVQEVQEHGAAAAEAAHGVAEKFDAGEVIIEHVVEQRDRHPLIHLPTILGIDFSVTKHVLMLWLVAAIVFVVVTWTVRRYLKQDRLMPSGFMNGARGGRRVRPRRDRAAERRQEVGRTPGRR